MDLVSLIKTVVQAELKSQPCSAFGIVHAVHQPDAAGTTTYACDVQQQGSDAIYEKVPLTAAYLGQVVLPMVGDLVVLQFIGGDPDQPVIAGCVFSENIKPPALATDERLSLLPHAAAENEQIQMRQTGGSNGSRLWQVALPDGPTLSLSDSKVETTLGDYLFSIDSDAGEATLSTGSATITLDEGGAITVESDGDMTFDTKGNLTVKAGGNAEIKASGSMALKGATIDLN